MYQKIILAGKLARDPELRYTNTGTAVLTMSIPYNEKYTSKDGQKVEKVTWFKVTVWGRQAETCSQYLNKGSAAIVEGTLVAGEDGNPVIFQRQNGQPGASFEIRASSVKFVFGNEPRSQAQEPEYPAMAELGDPPPF